MDNKNTSGNNDGGIPSIQNLSVRLESIFERSNKRLSDLLNPNVARCDNRQIRASKGGVVHFNQESSSLPVPNSNKISYEIILGRVHLSTEELGRLKPNTILPLVAASSGRVQIWALGKCCGEGILLVTDGKLSVKLESFSP